MNDTTFQGDGKITYVPVVANAKPQKPTNGDRIRAMTDEELARFVTKEDLCELTCGSSIPCDGRCEAKMLDWLKQEAKNEREQRA